MMSLVDRLSYIDELVEVGSERACADAAAARSGSEDGVRGENMSSRSPRVSSKLNSVSLDAISVLLTPNIAVSSLMFPVL